MKISPELLAKFELLKAGKVYYGDFAKDSSSHAAVVVTIHNDFVNFFCFTSQTITIERFKQKDPKATLELTKQEADLFFPNSEKDTYIYCGRSNWGKYSQTEFLELLSKGQISLKAELPDDLFMRIKKAIRESKTMTPNLIKDIGLDV